MNRSRTTLVALATLAGAGHVAAQGLEGDALRKALNDNAARFWIYDDLEAGYAAGRETGKPLLVTLRCVP